MSKHHDKHGEDQWRVEITLTKDGDEIVASADLFLGDAVYEAHGHAPRDRSAPTVAEELALARALSGLAHQLVDDAGRSVETLSRAVAQCAHDEERTYENLHA